MMMRLTTIRVSRCTQVDELKKVTAMKGGGLDKSLLNFEPTSCKHFYFFYVSDITINNYGKKFCKILKTKEEVAEEVGGKIKNTVLYHFAFTEKVCYLLKNIKPCAYL